MNTYKITFNLEGRENQVFISAYAERQAILQFEREYMHDGIISIEEQ